jgi:hypothetical protein
MKDIGANLANVMMTFLKEQASVDTTSIHTKFKEMFGLDISDMFGSWEISNTETDITTLEALGNKRAETRIFTLFNSKTGQMKAIKQNLKTGELVSLGIE